MAVVKSTHHHVVFSRTFTSNDIETKQAPRLNDAEMEVWREKERANEREPGKSKSERKDLNNAHRCNNRLSSVDSALYFHLK